MNRIVLSAAAVVLAASSAVGGPILGRRAEAAAPGIAVAGACAPRAACRARPGPAGRVEEARRALSPASLLR